MHANYRIRPTRADDIAALPPIELAAARLFVTAGWEDKPILNDALSPDKHRAYVTAGRSWVAVDADDQPVGFAVATEMDGNAHLAELDVHPAHGRRGIGRTLVEEVCTWARTNGYSAITLTTERDIPWNAPFYATLGFRILSPDELGEEIRAELAAEATWAPTPETRVAMHRTL